MVERGSRHQAENSCHSSSLSQPPPPPPSHADHPSFLTFRCRAVRPDRPLPVPRRSRAAQPPVMPRPGHPWASPAAPNARVRRAGAALGARAVRAGRHGGVADGVERAARAHLQVVDAQSTKGASDRRAAASEAAVHVLGRVLPARVRAGPAPGEERGVRRPRRGHRGPPPEPLGAAKSRRRGFVGISVNFGRFRSFFLLGVGIPVVLGDGMRAREIVGTRAPPQLLPSRPGRASAAVRDPPKSNQHPRLVVVDLAPILRRSVGAVMSMDRPPRRSTRGKAAGPAWHPCRARRRRRSAPRGGAASTIRARVSPERLPPAARLLRHI